MPRVLTVLLLSGAFFSVAGCARDPESRGQPETRSFHFEYTALISGIPSDAGSVRVWVPVPSSDENQTVSDLEVDAPVPVGEILEDDYGNRMASFEIRNPEQEAFPVKVSFDVLRREAGTLEAAVDDAMHRRFLSPDRLVSVDGVVASRAGEVAEGHDTREEIARAIYERVLSDVDYDKSGSGWGRGDTAYVCEVGRGNCTDFHSLFIGMARSRGIPAFFEIGFPLPADVREGKVGGYHCWAWYEDDAGVWRPVDASEADKDPARRDYFFGTLCCNRVAFTRGRDLVLNPPQNGEPLNYFIYPYVEVDGNGSVATVEKQFSFQNTEG